MPFAAERMDKMGLDERQKALDAAIAKIQKDYGQGSIMKLGDSMNNMDVEVIPTGALSPGYRPRGWRDPPRTDR